jgi:hypothetical protein
MFGKVTVIFKEKKDLAFFCHQMFHAKKVHRAEMYRERRRQSFKK